MALTPVCQSAQISEGSMELFRIGRKSVLLVWPKGGELRAYRGRCPHLDIPLEGAVLDQGAVVCGLHQWRFEANTGCGKRPDGHACELKAYPMKVVAGEVLVDLGGGRR